MGSKGGGRSPEAVMCVRESLFILVREKLSIAQWCVYLGLAFKFNVIYNEYHYSAK